MSRLQKRIAVLLILYLIVISALCLIDYGGGNSGKINSVASFVGLKSIIAAPTFESTRYGLSIISRESVRPNIGALLCTKSSDLLFPPQYIACNPR